MGGKNLTGEQKEIIKDLYYNKLESIKNIPGIVKVSYGSVRNVLLSDKDYEEKNKEREELLEKLPREVRVIFGKRKNNSYGALINLPTSFTKAINVSEENPDVILKLDEQKRIIIEKNNKTF